MSNKANIEEDIEIIKNHLMKIQRDTSLQIRISIENILADREEWKNNAEWFKRLCNKNEEAVRQLQAKANKYDSLVEEIKEKIEELNDVCSDYSQRVICSETSTYTELVQEVLQELLDTKK